MMVRRRSGVFATAALLSFLACDRGWAPGLPDSSRAALERWLFCDACDSGERAAAVGVGAAAVDALAGALERIPEAWRENMNARYGGAAHSAGLTGADSARYVRLHLANFNAKVQSRSGFALGDLDTAGVARAVQALREAIDAAAARGYRADVVRDLQLAFVTATAAPFGGTVSPPAAPFLDTVWITRPNASAWDGDESVALLGAPFPNDLVVGFRGSNNDSLGFLAAAQVGRYAVAIINVGQAQDTQQASFSVTSFPAPATRFIRDLTAGPFPLTILQSLSRATTPPDTLHFFRFHPAADLTVTATVDWPGPSVIDLVWDDCGNHLILGQNPGRVTGTVVDTTGTLLGAVLITLVGTGISAMTTALGQFDVPAVPPAWSGSLRASRIGYQLVTRPVREGAGSIWIVLRPSGSGPGPVFASQVSQSPSPNASTLPIAVGTCRLLGVLKRDAQRTSVITRLRITSP